MSTDAPGAATGDPVTDFEQAQRSESFQRLKRSHRSFVFPLGLAFLVWYFAYVLLADYAHEFMATPVVGNINVGLLLGLAQFLTTFAITTWYVSYANRKLDPEADEIRAHLTSGGHSNGSVRSVR
jgi:uncharacterized membrane protein (DUF485 family)